MNQIEIRWHGAPVGWLREPDLETVAVPQGYKVRGKWFAAGTHEGTAFLQELASRGTVSSSGRLEVTAEGIDSILGDGSLARGMHTFFSLGDDGECWLVITNEEWLRSLQTPVGGATD